MSFVKKTTLFFYCSFGHCELSANWHSRIAGEVLLPLWKGLEQQSYWLLRSMGGWGSLPFRQFAWQKQFLSSIQEMVSSSSSPTLWRSLEEKKMNKNKYRLGPRGPRLHESISACPPAALLAPGDPKCVFQSSFDASLKSHTKWAPSMSWNDHWHRLYKS